jgi:predicted TIM-barrel fold metal-dependent hydrolase
VHDAIGDGARVFKAHVQVGDFSPADPRLEAVWQILEDAGVPTIIHAGSGPAPGRFTGPAPVADVLARHPDLKLIIAHMGLPEYREFLDLAEQFDGVYLDTTMVFTDFTEQLDPFPREALPELERLADKVLFGSDYPNIPYPYHHAVEAITRLGLDDEWCRKVLYANAAALFGLG